VALRRWLLLALSLLSLFLLAAAGVGLAYSVVTGMGGERALVLPVPDPALVETGSHGALLAIGESGGSFPSSATNVTLERALAYAAPGTNVTVQLADVPMPNGTRNMTLDLAAMGHGKAGFVVKADDERDPRFVETKNVVGAYAGPTTTTFLLFAFVGGLLGFLLPLIALVVTHKPSGKPGIASGRSDLVCRECRAPLAAGAEFCQRCGAWRSGKEA
jgi:hypothetical protein